MLYAKIPIRPIERAAQISSQNRSFVIIDRIDYLFYPPEQSSINLSVDNKNNCDLSLKTNATGNNNMTLTQRCG